MCRFILNVKNEHRCHPYQLYTHRFSIARQSGGHGRHRFSISRTVCKHGSAFCLMQVYHRGPIQHIPTECNEQHGTSIRPSPSSSYSIHPPNVVSSMTYPSSWHRCILTVVRYCVGTVLDSICIHTVVRYMCWHRSRHQMHTRPC